MESTVQLTIQSFDSFKKGDFKKAESLLNKIKEISNRPILRIDENIILCEYLQNRSQNSVQYIKKIEELIAEINLKQQDKNAQMQLQQQPSSKKGSKKAQQTEEQAESQKEDHDFSILKYNYAVVLYFQGCSNKALQILEEILDNYQSNHLYINQKTALFLFDLAIQKKKENLISKCLNIIDEKKLIFQGKQQGNQHNSSNNNNGVNQNSPIEDSQTVKIKMLEEGNNNVDIPTTKDKSQYFCTVGFGSSLYNLGQPALFCNYEFYFILNILKAQLFVQYNDLKQAKKALKLSNRTLQKFFQVLNQKNNNNNSEKQKNNNEVVENTNNTQKYIYDPSIIPFIQKQCLTIFKFTKAFIAFKQENYLKVIKQLSPNSTVVTDMNSLPQDFYSYQTNFQIYQLNNLGCVNLRLKKNALAVQYFAKAVHICQQQFNEINSGSNINFESQILLQNGVKLKNVVYNLGLALLNHKKYVQAFNHLSQITDQIYDNYKLWYRIGTGLINIYHENLKTNYRKNQNGTYSQIIDNYNLRYSTSSPVSDINSRNNNLNQQQQQNNNNKKKQGNRKDSDLISVDSAQQFQNQQQQQQQKQSQFLKNQQPEQIFKRYVLQQKECLENKYNNNNQQEGSEDQNEQINSNNYYLDMAIKCFRNCVLLGLEKKIFYEKNQERTANIGIDNDIIDKLAKEEDISLSDKIAQEQIIFSQEQELNQLQKFLSSTYTQLAYLYTCCQEWNNTINAANQALKFTKHISEEDKFSNTMYLFESHIEMGNIKQATKITTSFFVDSLKQQQQINIDSRNLVAGRQASQFIDQLDSKIILNTNFALLHIKNGDLEKAQNSINVVLQLLDINPNAINADIPLAIINLSIYINIKNGNLNNALMFLKRRRLLTSMALNNNKALLEISK